MSRQVAPGGCSELPRADVRIDMHATLHASA
jgi:hypothetical protein